jgi:hypothetical protein
VLTLPLPIPLSNTLPGIAAFFLAGGLLRRSRRLLAAGHAMLWLSGGYLLGVWLSGAAGIRALTGLARRLWGGPSH